MVKACHGSKKIISERALFDPRWIDVSNKIYIFPEPQNLFVLMEALRWLSINGPMQSLFERMGFEVEKRWEVGIRGGGEVQGGVRNSLDGGVWWCSLMWMHCTSVKDVKLRRYLFKYIKFGRTSCVTLIKGKILDFNPPLSDVLPSL